MKVQIVAADDILTRYGNALGALGKREAHRALARAINRVTDTVHGRVIRAVAKQSSIPTATVRKVIRKQRVSTKLSNGGGLEGIVTATGSPLPLKEFKPKQFSWGVRAKVWGRQQRFPTTFINAGTYRSSKQVGNGHVFHRVTVKSLPIEKLFGPSIPEEMVKDQSKAIFERTVEQMLPARVMHEIGRLLPA